MTVEFIIVAVRDRWEARMYLEGVHQNVSFRTGVLLGDAQTKGAAQKVIDDFVDVVSMEKWGKLLESC